jgi:signal transduction histidine kinase/DNA-binding NarL/FixJ family response regulator
MALTGADHPGGLRANTLYRAVFFGLIWRRFGGDLREQCSRVAQLALAEGDLMTFGTAVRNGAVLGWRLAPSLREFAGELERLAADLIWLGDPALNAGVQEIRDAVSLVLDPAAPQRLRERWETLPAAPVNPLLEIELAVLSGDWVMAAALADRLRPFHRRFDNHPGGLLWRFYETLARLKTGRSVPRRDVALLERGARLSPDHGGPMMALIRAELRRRRGDPEAVMPLYAAAAEAAAQGPRPLVAGLAAECAADAARSFGRQDAARRFARQAAAVWSGWGAAWKLPRATPANEAGPEQETLIEAEARAAVAERADRAKARLLADVAHELRTPLQALQGLLDLAAEGGRPADPETLRDLLEGLRSVVDDLTEYGAQATGQSALALRPVAMADLLRTEASIAAGLRKDAAVELDCAPDLPGWVQTDPVRVRQVVRNLLANAVRHGGGTVRLRARHEPGAQDALTLHLVVEDSGPGIPPGQLRRLFEPFERGDTQAEGFGLGLAVASQLARRLGGALTAWNRPEGGAAFGFTLPTTLAPPPAAEAGGRVRTLRILLAEDQDLIRSSLAAILRADGHEVEAVGDGDAAGEALARQPFDLAVVDLRMPGRNGLEVLAGASREGPRRPSFILLTASTDPEVERRGLAAGAAAVLRKPVSANELRTLIGALFGDAPPGEPAEADLSREAAERLRLQLPDLLRSLQTPGDRAEAAEAAHRVAGLAAQFGWPEVAAACDALERDLRAGAAPGAALRGLERAGRAAGLLPQPA